MARNDDGDRLQKLFTREVENSKVAPQLHAHEGAAYGWPTLEDMILTGMRLVLFSDRKAPNDAAWDIHIWDFWVQTLYDNQSPHDLAARCTFHGNSQGSPLLIINHGVFHSSMLDGTLNFLTGGAVKEQGQIVNYIAFVLSDA